MSNEKTLQVQGLAGGGAPSPKPLKMLTNIVVATQIESAYKDSSAKEKHMKVNVYAYYLNCSITEIELPEGKTWDDVIHYHIKWGTLYITWKGSETPQEFQLSKDYLDCDHKRPDSITVFDEDHIEIIDEG